MSETFWPKLDTQMDTSAGYRIFNGVRMKQMAKEKKELLDTNAHIAQMFLETPTVVPLAEDVVLEDLAQNCAYQGREAVQPLILAFFREGFSEVTIAKQSWMADEKSIMVQFVFSGRQNGLFLGIPATGRPVILPMVLVCQISDARIHHIAWYYDAGTLLRQLKLAL